MAKKKESMENKRKVIASANIEDKDSGFSDDERGQGEGSLSDDELQEGEIPVVEGEGVETPEGVIEEEKPAAELEIQEGWPSWMQMVLEGLNAEDPEAALRGASDEELLGIKGVGNATLEKINAWVEEKYGSPERESGQVRIRIRPMRGVGGIGQAGTVADIDREYAEQLEAEGYVDILD